MSCFASCSPRARTALQRVCMLTDAGLCAAPLLSMCVQLQIRNIGRRALQLQQLAAQQAT